MPWKLQKIHSYKRCQNQKKIIIVLDGFDHISPDYSPTVEMLTRTIRDKTESKIWISSRLLTESYWRRLWESFLLHYSQSQQTFRCNSWNSTEVKLLQYPTKENCKCLVKNYTVRIHKSSVKLMGNLPASLYKQCC
jgi:hypothetical protein